MDNNVSTALPNQTNAFTNQTINQADPSAGNVYVAWATDDDNANGVANFNPNTIKMAVTTNAGTSFGAPFNVDTRGNFGIEEDTAPEITISQGSATVPAGPGERRLGRLRHGDGERVESGPHRFHEHPARRRQRFQPRGPQCQTPGR